ncbi:hypothetical protein TrLO_g11771 [Triparma laevis f. longispina]|uniref:Uncharacterized protein n=1 Tax=Triparma laevis f. longispina TaxID=1714387 RepID=A0A9W7EH89_9STRA|nr:hypothetical protein TrLO_g11771 [Triparma laevis f. longispina]
MKLRLQMILIAIAGFVNLVMFGLIDEGPTTPFMDPLLGVCILAIILLVISELFSVAFRGRGGVEEGVVEGNTGDQGMDVLDRMHSASSRGVDIV